MLQRMHVTVSYSILMHALHDMLNVEANMSMLLEMLQKTGARRHRWRSAGRGLRARNIKILVTCPH
jgi:hypothetical protein